MSTQSEILLFVIGQLEQLDIPYMLVGSFASNYWGRPRFTHDADMIVEIPANKAASLALALETDFYAPSFAIEEAIARRSHFNVIHLEQSFKVDFWVRRDEPYAREDFQRRQRVTMFGHPVWVSSPEDVILNKLRWYKISPVLDRQLQDALEVYEIQEPDLDQAYLDRWAARLEVTDLLTHIRAEAARPPDEE
ncbi:MAG: hypothetical protein IMY86_12585 [Chloroflexi bacterium]|jgi:hypothetical protein|nr:hypothetical protein [Chloroflexota bacterium]